MAFMYLKHIELPFDEDGYSWNICPISGSLVRSPLKAKTREEIPQKVADALLYCNNPYLCHHNSLEFNNYGTSNTTLMELERMYRIFVSISSKRFYLSRLYASISKILFNSTSEAMSIISQLPIQKRDSHNRCLQSTFLAAKTSKTFRDKGILFIGASLPSVMMHAWIIEDGHQSNKSDRDWINYRPMLALYF